MFDFLRSLTHAGGEWRRLILRIMFMGSAELSVPLLETVVENDRLELVGVVTQPDRPSGRRLRTHANPVMAYAQTLGVPILAAQDVNSEESLSALRQWAPEMAVVVAYGQILKPSLIALPVHGCVNVHTSLLPKYRGAAPIQWAIANGDKETGVTTMLIDAGMDTGDMLLKATVPIGCDDVAADVEARLVEIARPILLQSIQGVAEGTLRRVPQDDAAATRAPRLRRTDGQIDWTRPASEIYNRFRGFEPWPGCYTTAPDGRKGTSQLKIRALKPVAAAGVPGEILELGAGGPVVAAGDGGVRLLRVQPAGGKEMAGEDYVRGRRLQPGDRLGETERDG